MSNTQLNQMDSCTKDNIIQLFEQLVPDSDSFDTYGFQGKLTEFTDPKLVVEFSKKATELCNSGELHQDDYKDILIQIIRILHHIYENQKVKTDEKDVINIWNELYDSFDQIIKKDPYTCFLFVKTIPANAVFEIYKKFPDDIQKNKAVAQQCFLTSKKSPDFYAIYFMRTCSMI